MNNKDVPPPFEVSDPVAAFDRLEQAARHIMSVPKKKVDAMMAKEKASRKSKKRK